MPVNVFLKSHNKIISILFKKNSIENLIWSIQQQTEKLSNRIFSSFHGLLYLYQCMFIVFTGHKYTKLWHFNDANTLLSIYKFITINCLVYPNQHNSPSTKYPVDCLVHIHVLVYCLVVLWPSLWEVPYNINPVPPPRPLPWGIQSVKYFTFLVLC